MPDDQPSRRELGYYLALANVGVEMVAPIGIGWLIDYYAGTMPWGIVVCATMGFIGGIVHLIILANQQDQNLKNKPGDGRK